MYAVAEWSFPRVTSREGSQGRVVWLFCAKVGKITIRRPKKGPNPTTMDKQITKEFFRIKGCCDHSSIVDP